MRFLLLLMLVILSATVLAQNDIDVVYLKSGERIECTIQKIENDSIFFTQFSGRNMVSNAYPMDQTAAHLVNNIYTTPGEDLRKAAGHFYTGTSFIVIGGVVAGVALNDSKKELALAGMGFGLLGSIFLYSGYSKLKQAGKKLDRLHVEHDRIIFKL